MVNPFRCHVISPGKRGQSCSILSSHTVCNKFVACLSKSDTCVMTFDYHHNCLSSFRINLKLFSLSSICCGLYRDAIDLKHCYQAKFHERHKCNATQHTNFEILCEYNGSVPVLLAALCGAWSLVAPTLGSWVRIPLKGWMFVRVFLCCVALCR
jgi:hypothetical protein